VLGRPSAYRLERLERVRRRSAEVRHHHGLLHQAEAEHHPGPVTTTNSGMKAAPRLCTANGAITSDQDGTGQADDEGAPVGLALQGTVVALVVHRDGGHGQRGYATPRAVE